MLTKTPRGGGAFTGEGRNTQDVENMEGANNSKGKAMEKYSRRNPHNSSYKLGLSWTKLNSNWNWN